MAISISLELTQVLQLANALVAARDVLVTVEEELRRLAEVEMIPVRVRVDRRLLQVLSDQLAIVNQAVQQASGEVGRG